MVSLLREGCLVSAPATYFDIPGTPHEEKWSVVTFGEGWDSERCYGTVLKVLSGGQFAGVKWDIDGRSQRVGVANLQLEAEGRRVFQPLSYSSSSDAFDKESSSSSDSDDDASVKVRVRTRVISRANLPVEAGRGVLHNHSPKCKTEEVTSRN